MPKKQRRSVVVPTYKNGDTQNYTNYRGIKLLNHTMKLWESNGVNTKISENQFGFMLRRSTMEAIFSLRRLMGEK